VPMEGLQNGDSRDVGGKEVGPVRRARGLDVMIGKTESARRLGDQGKVLPGEKRRKRWGQT